ncbi:hypothetical protein D1AOALGA4SA_1239 [Olavius algarvensis Delta 1 endosymbiont]|nr:hypothetical protein D1AOALGA4SA_1239 [Olavius algarvensis Delta 1 endosymbiont]
MFSAVFSGFYSTDHWRHQDLITLLGEICAGIPGNSFFT